MSAEDAGSFLSKAFANCLIQIKRDFDKFVVSFSAIKRKLFCIFDAQNERRAIFSRYRGF